MKKKLLSSMFLVLFIFSMITVGYAQSDDRPDLVHRITIYMIGNEIHDVFCTRPGETCFQELVITADRLPKEVEGDGQ